MRIARWALALLVLGALICVPAGSGASRVSGNVQVRLINAPDSFVLDQPATAIFVVRNASSIVMRNGMAIVSSATNVVSSSMPACKSIATDMGAPACLWMIHSLAPGQTARYKLTLMFSSKDYPNATVPGTNLHKVVVELQAHNRYLANFRLVPLRIKTG